MSDDRVTALANRVADYIETAMSYQVWTKRDCALEAVRITLEDARDETERILCEALRVERDTALRTMQAQQKGMVKQGDAVRELQALVTHFRDAAQEALDIEGDALALNRALVEENTELRKAFNMIRDYAELETGRYNTVRCEWLLEITTAALAPVPEED